MTLIVNVTSGYRARRRRERKILRPIAAYGTMPILVGAAIESNRPVHLAFGSAGLGDRKTLLALADADFYYYVAREAAIGDISPIVTLSDSSTIPLAQDTLRRAYRARGRDAAYRPSEARWYPAGNRSMAYAAVLASLQTSDAIAANVLTGSFGSELALVMDAAYRRSVPTIAASDQLEGQAIAYAMADYPLIGEEIFVAGAYLQNDPGIVNVTSTLDFLRWLVILALVIITAVSALAGIGG